MQWRFVVILIKFVFLIQDTHISHLSIFFFEFFIKLLQHFAHFHAPGSIQNISFLDKFLILLNFNSVCIFSKYS